jgi:hypothetical protein
LPTEQECDWRWLIESRQSNIHIGTDSEEPQDDELSVQLGTNHVAHEARLNRNTHGAFASCELGTVRDTLMLTEPLATILAT